MRHIVATSDVTTGGGTPESTVTAASALKQLYMHMLKSVGDRTRSEASNGWCSRGQRQIRLEFSRASNTSGGPTLCAQHVLQAIHKASQRDPQRLAPFAELDHIDTLLAHLNL